MANLSRISLFSLRHTKVVTKKFTADTSCHIMVISAVIPLKFRSRYTILK